MLEEERTYQVDQNFRMPELAGCVPTGGLILQREPVVLRTTYYDTTDLRLARGGCCLRRDETGGWMARLPRLVPGTRHEVRRSGSAKVVPPELIGLLTVFHRGATVAPSVRLRTTRTAWEIRDADDHLLAEVCDDQVHVYKGRRIVQSLRQVEVEAVEGRTRTLHHLNALLLAGGAHRDDRLSTQVRALGPAAAQPPDIPWPPAPTHLSQATEIAAMLLRKDVVRLLEQDPLVRLRQPLPGGGAPVHQMLLRCHRLGNDLRALRPLLDQTWAAACCDQLRWLSGRLGAAEEDEVLRTWLRRAASADPAAPLEPSAIARIDADLAARHEDALQGLVESLSSSRYLALVETLVEAATRPRFNQPARSALRLTLPTFLGEALGEVSGAFVALQDRLSCHHDAAAAGNTWLTIAAADPDDHALAITAGRLFERERSKARDSRSAHTVRTMWRALGAPLPGQLSQ